MLNCYTVRRIFFSPPGIISLVLYVFLGRALEHPFMRMHIPRGESPPRTLVTQAELAATQAARNSNRFVT